MSGADELDEAVALANDSTGGGPSANGPARGGSSRRGGTGEDARSGAGRAAARSGPDRAAASGSPAEAEPTDERGESASRSGTAAASARAGTHDPHANRTDDEDDDLTAPAWLNRNPPSGTSSTKHQTPNPQRRLTDDPSGTADTPTNTGTHDPHANRTDDEDDDLTAPAWLTHHTRSGTSSAGRGVREGRGASYARGASPDSPAGQGGSGGAAASGRPDGYHAGHRSSHHDGHHSDHHSDQGHGDRDRGDGCGPGPAHGADRPGGRPLGWSEARAYAARSARPLPARTVPLDSALQHTLAAPLAARTDLPPFDTSAMDGWAVSGPGPWDLAEPPDSPGILAGDQREQRPLADGQAVRIATGARLPAGASAVLRSEFGRLDGARLGARHRQPQPGADIRPRGQECRSGDRLLPAGAPVTPAVLGLAAAAGYDQLTVVRRPRVEVLVLGEELLYRGAPRDGRIRDALGPIVGPWLSALGAEVLVTRRLGDDAEALHEAMAATTADLIVTTGGTAHGPVDQVRPTLRRLGARLLIDGVAVRPGHPMLLARLPGEDDRDGAGDSDGEGEGDRGEGQRPQGGPHFVGLPGNPLAALSGLVTLAAPLLRTLADGPAQRDPRAPLTEEVRGHPRDTRLVPVAYSPAESHARPLHYSGPAMLRGIATAGALAVVPPGGAAPGADVRLLPLPWLPALAW